MKQKKQKFGWNWTNISFFAFTHLVTLIGAPLYIKYHGITSSDIWLFAFYYVVTGMSITVGFHRYFAHKTYEAHPIVAFWNLFFGAAAFEMSALDWASSHRDHHRYADTEKDPYNINEGFFHAHIGWMLYKKYQKNHSNAKDLMKNKMVMNQHNYYPIWAIGAGVVLPVLIGAMFGNALGAFVLAVCARLVAVHQGTFCINSFCHMLGKSTYDREATARDHWLLAFVTWGEGYHNFHHRFPNDFRNGIQWYDWDPSKWTIALLSKIGLTSELRVTSTFRILNARITAENTQAKMYAHQVVTSQAVKSDAIQPVVDSMKDRYDQLMHLLYRWEVRMNHYKLLLEEHRTKQHPFIENTLLKLHNARMRFEKAHEEWEELVKTFEYNLKMLPMAKAS